MYLDTVNANRTGCAYEVYVLGGLSVAVHVIDLHSSVLEVKLPRW